MIVDPVVLIGQLAESMSLEEHPTYAKMWMIGGQIHMEKREPEKPSATNDLSPPRASLGAA